MAKSFGRRLLKAIHHKITAPLHRRLVNKYERIVRPAHEDRLSPTLGNHEGSSSYEKQTAKVSECGPIIHDPKRAPERYIVLDTGNQDRVPSAPRDVAVRGDDLQDEGGRLQPALVTQCAQQQHRSTDITPDIHGECTSHPHAALDVNEAARVTANKTPVTALEDSTRRHEVPDHDLNSSGLSSRDGELLTMQPSPLGNTEQQVGVGTGCNCNGFDQPCNKLKVMSRNFSAVTERRQIQQNVQASTRVSLLRRTQNTRRTRAMAAQRGHNRKGEGDAQVTAQRDPSIRPSDVHKMETYVPHQQIGQATATVSDSNTNTLQMKNTVLGVLVEQPEGFDRTRIGGQSGCPAEHHAESQPSCEPARAPVTPLTNGPRESQSHIVPSDVREPRRPRYRTVATRDVPVFDRAPGRPSSTVPQPSRNSSTGQPPQDRPSIIRTTPGLQQQPPTARTLNDYNVGRLKTSQAPRKHRRPATTRASPVITTTQTLTCSALLKEAWGHHARVCRVRGAAESYARAFGLEIASRTYQYVVMQCTFNATHGILMVDLCAIVSSKDPEAGQTCGDADRDNHLVPIEPNKPLPNATPIQAGFGDEGRHFGEHSWIDISKVYQVPADLIKDSRYVSAKLCRCSWEKMRKKLSMGTWAEERFRIEREFKRFLNTTGKKHAPDHLIRVSDNIPQLQPQSEPQHELRPRLRRYRVDELLHLQQRL